MNEFLQLNVIIFLSLYRPWACMCMYRKNYKRRVFKFCKRLQGCVSQGTLKMTCTRLSDWHVLIPVR